MAASIEDNEIYRMSCGTPMEEILSRRYSANNLTKKWIVVRVRKCASTCSRLYNSTAEHRGEALYMASCRTDSADSNAI